MWIVIRFAEIQIVNEPEKCCELIQNIIDSIVYQKGFVNSVKKVNRWTTDDAYEMAFKGGEKTISS
jgi:hypothetical protein